MGRELPIALQLYSVHKEMAADYRAVLERTARIGFEGVEFAGFFGVPAEEMKRELDARGLKAVGSHTGYEELKNRLPEVMRYNRILGNYNIVCPFCGLGSKEEIDAAVEELHGIERKLIAEGFVFHYHNHAHESRRFEGVNALERIFGETGIHPQPDIYWVYRGGEDPAGFIRRYSGRCILIHMKDGAGEREVTAGEGVLDFPEIIRAAQENGAEWLILEDEVSIPTAWDSVEKGYRYLKQCARKAAREVL